jgi:hypothetical protein
MLTKLLLRDKVKTLILMAGKECGCGSVENVMSVIEERLTVGEANQTRAFLKWAFFDWPKRSFGHGNYEARYEQWRTGLAVKTPCNDKNVKKLIKLGQIILKTMQESDRTTQLLKADLKEFLAESGITRGQLKRGY